MDIMMTDVYETDFDEFDEFDGLGQLGGSPTKRLAYVIKVYGESKRGPSVVRYTAEALIRAVSPEETHEDQKVIDAIKAMHRLIVADSQSAPDKKSYYAAVQALIEAHYNVDYPFAHLIPWYAREANGLLKKLARLDPGLIRTARERKRIAIEALLDYPLEIAELEDGRAVSGLTRIGLWAQAEKLDIMKVKLTNETLGESSDWEPDVVVPQGEIVYQWHDGWTMQELTTREQIMVEGQLMQNCLKQCDHYGWDTKVERGESKIFSLRDPNGKPHVSIELDVSSNTFEQVFGKQNEEPIDEYQVRVDEFAEEGGYSSNFCAQFEQLHDVVDEEIVPWNNARIDNYAELAFLNWVVNDQPGFYVSSGVLEPFARVSIAIDCSEPLDYASIQVLENWNTMDVDMYIDYLSEAEYEFAEATWTSDDGASNWKNMRDEMWRKLNQALDNTLLQELMTNVDLPDEDQMTQWLEHMQSGDVVRIEDGSWEVDTYGDGEYASVAGFLVYVMQNMGGWQDSGIGLGAANMLFDAFEEIFRKADVDVARGAGFEPMPVQAIFEFGQAPVVLLGLKATPDDLFQYGSDWPELGLFYRADEDEFLFIQEGVDGAGAFEVDEVSEKLEAKFGFEWEED